MSIAADDFALVISRETHGVVAHVHGEVDLCTATRFRDALLLLLETGEKTVQVDLAGMAFIDSTGLRALVEVDQRLRAAGGRLTVVNPTPATCKVLEITGLDRLVG